MRRHEARLLQSACGIPAGECGEADCDGYSSNYNAYSMTSIGYPIHRRKTSQQDLCTAVVRWLICEGDLAFWMGVLHPMSALKI